MFVQINSFGDFDVQNTLCIMESPNPDSDIKSLLIEFSNVYISEKDKYMHFKNTKNGIMGVKEQRAYTELFIEFLTKKGFKKLKTFDISISD